jgi:hypothetical protein
MNEDLERWCAEAAKPVELTRSRAYKSNDQAWVEQKNGMLVRRVVGHRRLEGPQQLERLCQLYAALRLFTNIYQPSAKRIRLRRATVERGAARVGATTNRSPRRIGCCVGVASVNNTAKALRRCSSNAIRWTCWRRFGGTKLLW